MDITRPARLTALAACLAMLTACGGGGHGNSGSGSTGGSGSTSQSGTVSGAAAKGLLLNAPVTFYGVSDGVIGTTALGSTRTDATTGAFSSTISSSGPVVAVVTVDGSTQMLDEISGASAAAPSGLVLHAVFDSLTDLQPIAVTPLTEMAYDVASASTGGLITANIDAANNAVSTLFLDGAPVLYTQPINLANYASATVAQQAQAKLLTALAVAASDGTATGASGSACTGTYSQELVCMVGGLGGLLTAGTSGTVSLTANAGYLSAAYASLDADTVDVDGGQLPSTLGLNVATTAETSFQTAFQQQNPLPGFNPGADPLANTKALVANIRTNILDQSTTQTFGYAPTLSALNSDFQSNVGPVLTATSGLIAAAFRAAGLIQSGVVDYSGNCGFDPTTFGTSNKVAVCRYGAPSRIQLVVTQTDSTTYTIATQPLINQGSECTGPSNPVTLGCPVNTAYSQLSAQLTWVSSGVESATLSGPYYVTATGGQVDGSVTAAESTDWNTATQTGTLSLSGEWSGGSGGVSLANATLGDDSVLTIQNAADLTGSRYTLLNPGTPLAVSGTIDLTNFTTSAFSYAAKVTLGTPVTDKSGSISAPGTLSVNGSISQLQSGVTTPLFDGTVSVSLQGVPSFDATQPISASNDFTTQGSVSGTVSLPDGRLLAVSASANGTQLVPTPTQPDSISATYSYTTPSGTAELNATGQYDATNGYSGTITNNAGVVIAVTLPVHGTLTGTITAGGTATATINGYTVYYSDDTSESLF